ncbi:hypothetical protein T4B_3587 [Trichinella pseudospiralis]|uniref:Uncharacterized protein n=1 Tax=Trichinella pseudospiralis TaxID=6337 RepID=A0A0V1J795_TRIPS|nr:hypothetical protein T4B_3587 [Trichinella pseudospiralis]KRZ45979.1 hypothetical protein T4C_12381 [Trichinella pseudospiralis]
MDACKESERERERERETPTRSIAQTEGKMVTILLEGSMLLVEMNATVSNEDQDVLRNLIET